MNPRVNILFFKTIYYTSFFMSLLFFLTLWSYLAMIGLKEWATPSTTSVQGAAPAAPVFGRLLFVPDAKKAFKLGPWWSPIGEDAQGRQTWAAVLYGKVYPVKSIPTALGAVPAPAGSIYPYGMPGGEVYGVKEGGYQYFPILIVKHSDGFKAAFPAAPVTVKVGPEREWDDKIGTTLETLTEQTPRDAVKSLIGPPTRETIGGDFKPSHRPCLSPLQDCVDFLQKVQIDEYDFTDPTHDFKMTYDQRGKFKKVDYLNRG